MNILVIYMYIALGWGHMSPWAQFFFFSESLIFSPTDPRPLISFRTTPCCVLRKVKETSGGPEGDSKSVHTKSKGVGLSEI